MRRRRVIRCVLRRLGREGRRRRVRFRNRGLVIRTGAGAGAVVRSVARGCLRSLLDVV